MVTPVALMLPVEIGGVTVSRATLHNREEVERKDVREGDRVRIQRAGDVIPQVLEVIPEPGRRRSRRFRMPSECPSCGTELVERGPFTVCTNAFECPAQLAGRIIHYGSRHASTSKASEPRPPSCWSPRGSCISSPSSTM